VRVPDVVVTAQPLVRAERLALSRGERGFVDVGTRDVPAGREPRLIQRQRAGGVGDDPAAVTDNEVAAGLADVDAVVGIGGVADDPLVLLVEGVHGPPRERHPPLQFAGVAGQVGVLPCHARPAVLAGADGVPGGKAEVTVPGGVLAGLQHAIGDIRDREVGHRVTARLVQQHDVFAVGDPCPTEPDPHATAQWLGEQQPFRETVGDQEPANRSFGKWSLLPG